ncbi:glycosyltransferase (plasmid) [Tistrella mobilis]|uniref:CgeB family protein n=1 Tax=Tistrella mobilis TaxID=171437 RepID=UPI0035566ED3
MTRPLDITILGLSLSSSWGNGHATTFRALIRGLHARGHRVTFLERDVPWYASQRDLADPDFCRLVFYDRPAELETRHRALIAGADAVLIGSYVPDGIEVIRRVMTIAGGPVGFYDIDTPVTLARLDEDQCSWLSRMLIPAFDVYFSFTGGPLLDRLERDYGARRALPLYCAVDADRYAPAGGRPLYDLSYLGTYSPDRQPGLERLLIEPARRLPDRRFIVAGPQYPDDIDWPANVERVDHVAPADHPAFYAASAFTLSVTRAEMMATGWSPSVRLFEAGACGTPVISDRQPGLEAIFPESEAILIADTTDEVVRLLTTIDAPARARIAAAARAAVLGAHTGRHRADELIAGLVRPHEAHPPVIQAMEGQTMAGQRERTGDDAHSPA